MSPRIAANSREQYLQERREQILDAAVDVFGQKGFAAANVADIAKAAGVAKGTIYLYFESKEAVFTTLMAERSFLPRLAHLVEEDQPVEVTLRNIAEGYFQDLEANLPIFRLVIADAARFPDYARQAYREVVLKGNQLLADFLEKQGQAGKIRALKDPFLTARAFMGMLMTYIFSQEILGGKDITPICREAWIEEVLRVFLESLNPECEEAEKR